MTLKLMYLPDDPIAARVADSAGVDRIFVDLEFIGKAERQRGTNSFISRLTIDDIPLFRAACHEAELLVRVNPLHPSSRAEIDAAIEGGADVVMLPMFVDAEDAHEFIDLVARRARTCLLVETPQALTRLEEIADVQGLDELYFGLNDLHLALGLNFMFELLAGGLLDYMASIARSRSIPFGFGGIARIGDGTLPAEKILAEHYRLGSSAVILSRAFRAAIGDEAAQQMQREVERIRKEEAILATWTDADHAVNHSEVVEIVRDIAQERRCRT